MPLKTAEWNLLLERPALRHTLDVLRGYCWPASVCAALCQQHTLTESELVAVRQLHASINRPGQRYTRRSSPRGRRARNGLDLLLSLPRLQKLLDTTHPVPPLDGVVLERLRDKFQLTPAELVGVFNAHADLLARI